MRKKANYGKGGIGKSTTTQNLTAVLGEMGKNIIIVGCDPKADSTRLLLEGLEQKKVLVTLKDEGEGIVLDSILKSGFVVIKCVESKDMETKVDCAERAIITSISILESLSVYEENLDYVFYDVLGDVVCGGFATQIRKGKPKEIYIVVSGELITLYVAHHIAKGIQKYTCIGETRPGGNTCNIRNIVGELELLQLFAKEFGSLIIDFLSRDVAPEIKTNKKTNKDAQEENQSDQDGLEEVILDYGFMGL